MIRLKHLQEIVEFRLSYGQISDASSSIVIYFLLQLICRIQKLSVQMFRICFHRNCKVASQRNVSAI